MASALCLTPSSSTTFWSTHRRELALRRQMGRGCCCIPERGRNYHGGGDLVDENLIVLRKRIRERKMMERNYEPPRQWMEWEKQLYGSYHWVVCEAVGLLQWQLINIRPSFALAMVLLLTFSVPTSIAVLCSYFIRIVSGIHLT